MPRQISFERLASTEDSGDPVVRAFLEDTESFVDAIILQDEEEIRVWFAMSKQRGDMKILMDEIVSQLEITRVLFLSPLSEKIEDRLRGFERNIHEVETPEGKTREQEFLEGEWDPDLE